MPVYFYVIMPTVYGGAFSEIELLLKFALPPAGESIQKALDTVQWYSRWFIILFVFQWRIMAHPEWYILHFCQKCTSLFCNQVSLGLLEYHYSSAVWCSVAEENFASPLRGPSFRVKFTTVGFLNKYKLHVLVVDPPKDGTVFNSCLIDLLKDLFCL